MTTEKRLSDTEKMTTKPAIARKNRAEQRKLRRMAGLLLMSIVGIVALPLVPVASAQSPNYTIAAGTDTLTTQSAEIAVNGEALVTLVGCGEGDTVVERLTDVIGVPGVGGVAVGATALSFTHLCLFTDQDGVYPPSNDRLYVTLQSERGLHPSDPPVGLPSLGAIVVTFNPSGTGGTFNSTMVINYDVRLGAEDGPIVVPGMTSGPMSTQVMAPTWARDISQGPAIPFCKGHIHRHCVIAVSTTGFVPGAAPPPEPNVPTLSAWGVVGLVAAIGGFGMVAINRRK